MVKPEDDAQLPLKKRARRRLVGAIAWPCVAAVVLPMVMDQAPPAPVQDVQIRIPGQDQAPHFNPKPQAARPAPQPVAENRRQRRPDWSKNLSRKPPRKSPKPTEKPLSPSWQKNLRQSSRKAGGRTPSCRQKLPARVPTKPVAPPTCSPANQCHVGTRETERRERRRTRDPDPAPSPTPPTSSTCRPSLASWGSRSIPKSGLATGPEDACAPAFRVGKRPKRRWKNEADRVNSIVPAP